MEYYVAVPCWTTIKCNVWDYGFDPGSVEKLVRRKPLLTCWSIVSSAEVGGIRTYALREEALSSVHWSSEDRPPGAGPYPLRGISQPVLVYLRRVKAVTGKQLTGAASKLGASLFCASGLWSASLCLLLTEPNGTNWQEVTVDWRVLVSLSQNRLLKGGYGIKRYIP